MLERGEKGASWQDSLEGKDDASEAAVVRWGVQGEGGVGGDSGAQDGEPSSAELYEQIGRLKIELHWIKNKVAADGVQQQGCGVLSGDVGGSAATRPAGDFPHGSGVAVHEPGVHGRLAAESMAISSDGKGRAINNVMIERWRRTVKYENIDLKDDVTGADCHPGLLAYLTYDCHEGPHQSLANQTPGTPSKPLAANPR